MTARPLCVCRRALLKVLLSPLLLQIILYILIDPPVTPLLNDVFIK